MRLVHIKHHLRITPLQRHQTKQVGHIAVHTEYTLRHNHHPRILRLILLHQRLQLPVVLMTITDTAGRRQTDTVYQTGMHQFVGQNQRLGIRHRRQDSHIHVVTAVEDQCPLRLIQVGKQFLQLRIHRKIPCQQPGRRSREKKVPLAQCLHKLLPQLSIRSQPQIVVGRKVQQTLPLLFHPLAFINSLRQPAQVSLRSQLLQFIQIILIKFHRFSYFPFRSVRNRFRSPVPLRQPSYGLISLTIFNSPRVS